MAATKSTPDIHPSAFPLAGLARDGWSTETEATATCFCGAVQLRVPLTAPGLVDTFICNCPDCHKITASMFASNFTVLDTHTSFIRGEANLTAFGQSDTIGRGHLMTNYFCRTCGTLMYRVGGGFPGMKIPRIGTVDDFRVMEGALRPRREQFTKYRVGWLEEVEDTVKSEGMGE
ncbi:hypothetical protein DPSP01_007813 [Paraphaeosphaeria sporulosa]|uniref:CENP-V/GFA domain-containing protein n=1 Tax=Paraphaeosphaeria sporulosa TaxID=1460663 RepID=A0A177CIX0_9PLEO|nr:uncharacterized protein CC84DRAFT_1089620 [Paraphaeosphaeria sporulosa]OAG07453.1 hypothetical protein CC84DRAFT_1089620 [Paraphaeosphaeria sporulosa]